MSAFMTILTAGSLAVLLAISVYRFAVYRNARGFVLQLVAVTLCFAGLYVLFYAPEIPTGKGADNEVYFVIVLYLCMLAGMAAQYGYTRFSQPKRKRKKIDWGLFAAPVFASPIVFLPLLAALQHADIADDAARLAFLSLQGFDIRIGIHKKRIGARHLHGFVFRCTD